MLKKLIALNAFVVTLGLAGCNVGSSVNPTISASVPTNTSNTSSCPTLTTTGATCTISVVYNTNKVSGVSLGYTPNPLPTSVTSNGMFYSTFGPCQSAVGSSSGSTTCTIIITYTTPPGGGGTNSTIAFTLGNATSNTITIKGD
jgi:hypothetical protein